MIKFRLLTIRIVQWLTWRLTLPLLLLNAWCLLLIFQYFRTPVTLLVVGSIVAFLLQYPLRRLERLGIKRNLAIGIVLLGALLLVTLLGMTVIPVLIQQAEQLTNTLGIWENTAAPQIQALHDWVARRNIPIDFNQVLLAITDRLSNEAQTLTTRLPELILGTFGGVFEFSLGVVITIYLVAKGDQLWNGILDWFPPRLRADIRTALPRSFQNYFIGQGAVALTLGVLMSLAFVLLQIPFGLLFGAFIGSMALFPYGAAIAIALVAILVSLKSIGLGLRVVLIAVLIDQMVESGIAPRFLGKLTGVHPVWVIIALLVGGKIAGVLGFILAVPLASFIKIMLVSYRPQSPAVESPEI
jgi:predicted PurR-regulated permease PerM